MDLIINHQGSADKSTTTMDPTDTQCRDMDTMESPINRPPPQVAACELQQLSDLPKLHQHKHKMLVDQLKHFHKKKLHAYFYKSCNESNVTPKLIRKFEQYLENRMKKVELQYLNDRMKTVELQSLEGRLKIKEFAAILRGNRDKTYVKLMYYVYSMYAEPKQHHICEYLMNTEYTEAKICLHNLIEHFESIFPYSSIYQKEIYSRVYTYQVLLAVIAALKHNETCLLKRENDLCIISVLQKRSKLPPKLAKMMCFLVDEIERPQDLLPPPVPPVYTSRTTKPCKPDIDNIIEFWNHEFDGNVTLTASSSGTLAGIWVEAEDHCFDSYYYTLPGSHGKRQTYNNDDEPSHSHYRCKSINVCKQNKGSPTTDSHVGYSNQHKRQTSITDFCVKSPCTYKPRLLTSRLVVYSLFDENQHNCHSLFDEHQQNCHSLSDENQHDCHSLFDEKQHNCYSLFDENQPNCHSLFDEIQRNCHSLFDESQPNCNSLFVENPHNCHSLFVENPHNCHSLFDENQHSCHSLFDENQHNDHSLFDEDENYIDDVLDLSEESHETTTERSHSEKNNFQSFTSSLKLMGSYIAGKLGFTKKPREISMKESVLSVMNISEPVVSYSGGKVIKEDTIDNWNLTTKLVLENPKQNHKQDIDGAFTKLENSKPATKKIENSNRVTLIENSNGTIDEIKNYNGAINKIENCNETITKIQSLNGARTVIENSNGKINEINNLNGAITKIENCNGEISKIQSLNGAITVIENSNAKINEIRNWNGAITRIENFNRTISKIENLNGARTVIENYNGKINEIRNLNGAITKIKNCNGTISKIQSLNGAITVIENSNGKINEIRNWNGAITRIENFNGTISKIQSLNGAITVIENSNGKINEIRNWNGAITRIENYNGTIFKIENLNRARTVIENYNGKINEIRNLNGAITKIENSNGTITKIENLNDAITAIENNNGKINGIRNFNGAITKIENSNGTISKIENFNGARTVIENYNGKINEIRKLNWAITKIENTNGIITKIENLNDSITAIENYNGKINEIKNFNRAITKIENSYGAISKIKNCTGAITQIENSNGGINKVENYTGAIRQIENSYEATHKIENCTGVITKIKNSKVATAEITTLKIPKEATTKIENSKATASKKDSSKAVTAIIENYKATIAIIEISEDLSAITLSDMSATAKLENHKSGTAIEKHKAETTNKEATTVKKENSKDVTANIENHKVETNKIENHKAETSNIENHKVETNKIENHKAETSNIENHKSATANIENHKAETSKIENHKAETANIENHKAETANIENQEAVTLNIENHKSATANIENHKAETAKKENSKDAAYKVLISTAATASIDNSKAAPEFAGQLAVSSLDDIFDSLINTMQSHCAPDCIQDIYLISGYDKICVEVSNGHVAECEQYLQTMYTELYNKHMFDVTEEGTYHLSSDDKLTSDEVDQTTGQIVKEPGMEMRRIEAGCTLTNGKQTTTLTMLAKDVNNKDRPYVITVKHLYSKKPEYVCGVTNTYVYFESRDVPLLIGDSYRGAMSSLRDDYSSSALTEMPDLESACVRRGPTVTQMPHYDFPSVHRPEVDVAAIPLTDSLIDSDLVENKLKGGSARFDVFTGSDEDIEGTQVEITGSRCGGVKGTVYPFRKRHKLVDRKPVRGSDYIAIVSENVDLDHMYCRDGDSGSLATDDITKSHRKVYNAYGILFRIKYDFVDRLDPQRRKRRLAMFVRLDNCFNELNNKWNINLKCYEPSRSVDEMLDTEASVTEASCNNDGEQLDSLARSGSSITTQPITSTATGHADQSAVKGFTDMESHALMLTKLPPGAYSCRGVKPLNNTLLVST